MIQFRSKLFFLPIMMMAIVFTGCNRKMETAAVKNEAPPTALQAPSPEAPRAETIPPVQSQAQVPRQVALETPVKFEDAYFDFDKSLIRQDARKALDEDMKLLKEHPAVSIKIEGHCDERGTEEYNLALGNRRAEGVKRYLIGLGVEPSRITTISYGKDKPFCTEHNETCYQDNRRGHFLGLTVGN